MTILRSRKLTFWLNRPPQLSLTCRTRGIQTRPLTTISSTSFLFFFFMVHVFCLPLVREKKSLFGVVWSLSTGPWKCIASFNLFIYLFRDKFDRASFFAGLSTQTQEHPLDLSGQLASGSLLHWMPQATQLDSLLSLLNPIIKRRVCPVEAITSGPPLWAAIWTFPCHGGICLKHPFMF